MEDTTALDGLLAGNKQSEARDYECLLQHYVLSYRTAGQSPLWTTMALPRQTKKQLQAALRNKHQALINFCRWVGSCLTRRGRAWEAYKLSTRARKVSLAMLGQGE